MSEVSSATSESRLLLAIQAIQDGKIQSRRAAANTYIVDRKTLGRRLGGILSRHDCTPNSRKLTNLEEQVITQRVLDLDSRGFPPRLRAVEDMANKLLADRVGGKVGIKWASNFVKRCSKLKTSLGRKYDSQRAKCEDPELITQWFELVRNTIAKYGIVDSDMYNFDETGFQMGVISTGMVVTASERRNRPKVAQPGNREWVTVIQGVNGQGWAIPPFLIFKGRCHLSAWYSDDVPHDWVFAVSDNGWTTNELGFQWLQHFEKHTKDRTMGVWRLLILDGHQSHVSAEFDAFCQEHKIITLCMPAHASHLLQPLDVGCFAPLKRAYGKQVEDLMRSHINHITKLEFLPAFKAAFEAAFTRENIKAGFRGAGLVPLDTEAVISKLDIRLRTPTPPKVEVAGWDSQTPHNAAELACQTELIKGQIAKHQDSSPTPINNALDRLQKAVQMMACSTILIQAELTNLRNANEAAMGRKKRQKRRIKQRGTLTVQAGQDLINEAAVNQQTAQETCQIVTHPQGPATKRRRCGQCGKTGHNSRTCQEERQIVVK